MPTIAILELAQKIATHLIHKWLVNVVWTNACVAMPANVHGCVYTVLVIHKMVFIRMFACWPRKCMIMIVNRRIGLLYKISHTNGVQIVIRRTVRLECRKVALVVFVVAFGFLDRFVQILQPFRLLFGRHSGHE